MRAILVSGGLLAIAAVFGLGVIVGRFVLSHESDAVSAPTNAIAGPIGPDNPLADPYAVLSTDPSLNAPPPAIAAPLPPATPPGQLTPPVSPIITARAESDAAIASGDNNGECNIVVAQNAPIRSWGTMDKIKATAIGPTCGTGIVRIILESAEGGALYTLQAPARDFGIKEGASADDVRNTLTQLLPTNAVRAAAYPEWLINGAAPTRTEFSRDSYEAIRTSNAPVICLKLPASAQRCVAAEPTGGQVRVFSRG
jgi:hypothetical protein